ncbi:CG6490, partial [Drosophila busckii]
TLPRARPNSGRPTGGVSSALQIAAITQPKNSSQLNPFLQIKKHAHTRLSITNPHATYFLHCTPIYVPIDYYEESQPIYCSWYRNNEAIEHLSIRKNDFFIYKNGTLRLPPNERASGVYYCKIESDDAGVRSDSITVEYPVLKRNFTAQSSNISVVEHQLLVLDCPFVSVPAARISWYFGNDSLANDSRRVKISVLASSDAILLSNGTLVLRGVRLEQAGKYKCVAQNPYTSRNHRQFVWQVHVAGTEQQQQQQAAAITELLPALQNATMYVPTGGSLLLLCRAQADYVPIDWYMQHPNNTVTRLSNNSVALAISNVSMARHEGYYICTTPTHRQMFHVVVTSAPRILNTLPVELGYISLSTTLSCRAAGNPMPHISWYHNGAPLNSSYTRYISGNELHIHSFDPEEEGIYQCFARNVAGEDSVTGEMRFKRQPEQPNPLQNIRCYPHSFHTINVTFDSRTLESMFVVHIVRSNPHSWSSLTPMKLNHSSFVVISNSLPVYRPFALITRFLYATSELNPGSISAQRLILSSLRSPAVICCTQGLMLRLVHLGNDTFVKWSQAELEDKKYFIIQFSINHTHPHPAQLLEGPLHGTLAPVAEKPEKVRRLLTVIQPLNLTAAATVLHNAEHEVLDNEVDDVTLEMEEDIFSIVVHANVTGLLLQHFSRIKMRVLIITAENEFLAQDFRYVQWKTIENGTSEQANKSFRLITMESRMLAFQFLDSLNDTCVYECHLQVQLPIPKQEPKCRERTIVNSVLLVNGLNANESYNFHFYNCKPQIFYGEMDVTTLPDPPGTISNAQLLKSSGLKLVWDPPLHPNGRVHHYDIRYTLGNVTHEATVLESDCSRRCTYKFPNVSETDKIHVAVRVVGETGVGAPIFFDLIDPHILPHEHNRSRHEVYSGIAIGSLLSILCVLGFASFIILQRRRFKARAQAPTHLTTPTDINFGNLSSASGMPGDSAGGLSGGTLQQDCHEMQTLIPRSRYHIELLPEHTLEYQTSTTATAAAALPNGNGVARRSEQEAQLELSVAGVHNLSQLPLCGGGSPERKTVQDAMLQDAKAFYIPYRHTPPNAVALQAAGKQNGGELGLEPTAAAAAAVPPNSLPLVAAVPGLGHVARRSGSLSSSSASSSSNGSSKKQFHTNFTRHSNSNDGICLLAEEESAATLTPTSEHEYAVAAAGLSNGFKLPAELSKQCSQSNNNNSNSSSNKQQQSQSHLNASIVPANGPQARSTVSVHNNKASMTKHPWPAATNLHRRAQVDPNG